MAAGPGTLIFLRDHHGSVPASRSVQGSMRRRRQQHHRRAAWSTEAVLLLLTGRSRETALVNASCHDHVTLPSYLVAISDGRRYKQVQEAGGPCCFWRFNAEPAAEASSTQVPCPRTDKYLLRCKGSYSVVREHPHSEAPSMTAKHRRPSFECKSFLCFSRTSEGWPPSSGPRRPAICWASTMFGQRPPDRQMATMVGQHHLGTSFFLL
jgi:hypothetical protein